MRSAFSLGGLVKKIIEKSNTGWPRIEERFRLEFQILCRMNEWNPNPPLEKNGKATFSLYNPSLSLSKFAKLRFNSISGMSFFKDLADSLGSIFSDTSSSSSSQQNPNSDNNRSMEGISAGGTPVSNERTAYKLKGYFDLAKEVIAKAVRAEEWGLVDDAISHYQNAQRILVEAISTPVPSYITSRYCICKALPNFVTCIHR